MCWRYRPEFDSDPLRRYPGKHGGDIRWQPASATASGFLDLAPDGVAAASVGVAQSPIQDGAQADLSFAETREEIEKIVSNDIYRFTLGLAGMKRCYKNFTYEHYVSKHEEFYHEILKLEN